MDLNPGPCDPHTNALTTRLCRSQENGALLDAFLYHYYGWLSNNGLWGCQWPRRSLLTSNLNSVTSTTPISTAFQASTATISRIFHGRISSVDLRPRTSSQVKICQKTFDAWIPHSKKPLSCIQPVKWIHPAPPVTGQNRQYDLWEQVASYAAVRQCGGGPWKVDR